MNKNWLIRLGEWLERKPLAMRLAAVESRVETEAEERGADSRQLTIRLAAAEKEVKELKEYVAKMAMYVGMKPIGKSPEDIRQAITAWGALGK